MKKIDALHCRVFMHGFCRIGIENLGEKEDIELLLSSVAADLDEIETEIKIFIDMIEDTDQFISAHLDSVRNKRFLRKGSKGVIFN